MSEDIRGGVVPYFYDNNELYVHLMIPSNKDFGGIYPQIAKGVINKGEDIKSGSIREAEEELGFKKDNVDGNIELLKDYNMKGMKLHIYIAKVIDPDNFNRPHYETGWSSWLQIDDAIEKCANYQKPILQDIKEIL